MVDFNARKLEKVKEELVRDGIVKRGAVSFLNQGEEKPKFVQKFSTNRLSVV